MAAYINILKATHKLVYEAQQSVIDDLADFLGKHIEIDDEFTDHVNDFKLDSLKLGKTALKRRRLTPEEKVKKAERTPKRNPSEYNKFMKSEMAVIRTETPQMLSGLVFAEAVRRWQEKKKALLTSEANPIENSVAKRKA
jgi:hypothetical protein